MLAISLTCSVFGLIAMNTLVRVGRIQAAIAVSCLMIIFCPFSWAFFYQGLLTLPVFLALALPKRGLATFTVGSVVAMLAAYAVPFHSALKEDRRLEALRQQFPMISLEERLPPPPRPESQQSGGETALLREMESALQDMSYPHWALQRLHSDRVSSFINSPGFGVGRMSGPVRESQLQDRNPAAPVRQPDPSQRSEGDPGIAFDSRSRESSLLSLHAAGVIDFANPQGFGYIRSRREVAGFRPHRFSEVPNSKDGWAVNAVELVGVLMHNPPRVYVSEHLPRMEELASTKTRPLDLFESENITALKTGDDLVMRSVGDGARMLGAIRNAKQCLECHGGNRGDLLGAFSYQLRRTGP